MADKDSLKIKSEKLLKYGKEKLIEKGVTEEATTIREILNNIGLIPSLPSGILKITSGTITFTEDKGAGDGYNITHGLGEIPNAVIFWDSEEVNLSYSIINATRLGNYYSISYHGNSSTTTTVSSSYGIVSVTNNEFTVQSTSNNVYFRAGRIYKWVAIV